MESSHRRRRCRAEVRMEGAKVVEWWGGRGRERAKKPVAERYWSMAHGDKQSKTPLCMYLSAWGLCGGGGRCMGLRTGGSLKTSSLAWNVHLSRACEHAAPARPRAGTCPFSKLARRCPGCSREGGQAATGVGQSCLCKEGKEKERGGWPGEMGWHCDSAVSAAPAPPPKSIAHTANLGWPASQPLTPSPHPPPKTGTHPSTTDTTTRAWPPGAFSRASRAISRRPSLSRRPAGGTTSSPGTWWRQCRSSPSSRSAP